MERKGRIKMAEELDISMESFFENSRGLIQFMTMYNSAIKEVRTKFEILNDDLSVDYDRNPIEMIKSRIKTPESIIKKLKKWGEPNGRSTYDMSSVRWRTGCAER